MATVTINTIDTYTDKYFIRKLIDNFFLNSALWMFLREGQRTFDGGTDIRVPMQYTNTSAARRFNGRADTFDTNFVEHATLGVFGIRWYITAHTLTETDLLLNKGKAKILDAMAAQSKLSEDSLVDLLGQDVYKTGAADANGRLGLNGLSAVCTYNSNPDSGNYAGIPRTSSTGTKNSHTGNAFHNSNVWAANANGNVAVWKYTVAVDNSTTLTRAKMQQMYQACCRNRTKPKLISTSSLLYNKYHDLLTDTLRQFTSDKVGKWGFDHLMYINTPVVADDNIDNENKMYFITPEHLYLMVVEGADFKSYPARTTHNGLLYIKPILWGGNLVCDNAGTQGLITGLTA